MLRIPSELKKRPGTSLVLSGGATKSFYFHVGVLKALQDEPITSVVGSSAGAMVGAFMASGATVNDLITSIYQPEIYLPQFDKWMKSLTSTMLFRPNLSNLLLQSIYTTYTVLKFGLGFRWLGMRDVAAEFVDEVVNSQRIISHLFDAAVIEDLFKELLPSANFHDTLMDLYVIATDLDNDRRAVFNSRYDFSTEHDDFMTDVPLHRAVRASIAIPALFEPVTIKGRTYVDGEVKRTLSADIGVALADRVIISHTYQPVKLPGRRSVRELGWWNILKQSGYIVFHERIKVWERIYRTERPDKQIIMIQPDPDDEEFFLAPQFTFRPEIQRRLIQAGEEAARKALAKYPAPLPLAEQNGHYPTLQQPEKMIQSLS